MLLNIVKMRYSDAPIFLNVASNTNQYSFDTEFRGTLGWSSPSSTDRQEIVGTCHYYDRPAITYSPLTEDRFARSLIVLIVQATVMSLVEGGYPIDLVFRMLVHAIDGIQNQVGGLVRMRLADPQFYLLLQKMREIQASEAVALRVKKTENNTALVLIFEKEMDGDSEAEAQVVQWILGLRGTEREYWIVYGSIPANHRKIALLIRSIIEVLSDISEIIEMLAIHVATSEPSRPWSLGRGDARNVDTRPLLGRATR